MRFNALFCRYKKGWFFLLICLLYNLSLTGQNNISNYKKYFATASYIGKSLVITRKFEQAGKAYYYAVDANTLEPEIIAADQVAAIPQSWPDIFVALKDAPYIKALLTAQKQSFSWQDAGIVHGYPKEKGITLTIDLCPSHKPLDRIIFTSIIAEFEKTERPVPVALSITGRFMLTHSEDINRLKTLIKSGEINVTWINHTYNHRYSPRIPLKDNFLLEPGTDLDFEILGTEIALLQHGLLPSVFFRFPGLVSDNRIVDLVTAYGLIPIGSDAWLAKGQEAHAGSIVLIHGNGNEPIGVNDFINLLRSQKTLVENKQWLMYDLRESIDDEFKE